MPDASPNPPLTARLEQQLADAGLQVTVEDAREEHALILSGFVDTEEARQAATDIATQVAPGVRIDNQLEIETIQPTDVDAFVSDSPSASLPDSATELADDEVAPDFTDRRGIHDPNEAMGADSWGPEDPAESGDVYTPPTDPVVTTDARGQAEVLGGFATASDEEVTVEPSALDNRPGDEALADAIRQELREDASTADLSIVVAVRGGVAHLRGQVAGLEDAENAEAVAARVPGVREVIEELDVTSV